MFATRGAATLSHDITVGKIFINDREPLNHTRYSRIKLSASGYFIKLKHQESCLQTFQTLGFIIELYR